MRSRSVMHRFVAIMVIALFTAAITPFSVGAAAKGVSATGVEAQVILGKDVYEPDDTTSTATVYNPATMGNTWVSYHTFHDLGMHDASSDESDYVKVNITKAGTPIFVETQRVGAGFYDTELYIYDSTGSQVAYNDDSSVWWETYSSNVYYEAPAPGTYYIEAYNLSGYSSAYELYITLGDARRVAGSDRYRTAAEVSRLMYDNTDNPEYTWDGGYGPNKILIASGVSPWDALAGGAAAAASLDDGSVLLLTEPGSLPSATLDEIMRVTQSQYSYDETGIEIFVLGGTSVVSDTVMGQLSSVPGVTNVERISGNDRFETAYEIGALIDGFESVSSTAFVVSGYSWPDAIAVAPVAGYNYSPVLMTSKDDVPDATMDFIDDYSITDIVVVGGSAVVGNGALNELRSAVGTANVEVVAGMDRYATARYVAQYGVDEYGMSDLTCQLVSGENFPDALSAAALSTMTEAPTLLTTKGELNGAVTDFFETSGQIGDSFTNGGPEEVEGWGCWVIGGEAAVSSTAYNEFRDLWSYIQALP